MGYFHFLLKLGISRKLLLEQVHTFQRVNKCIDINIIYNFGQ